MPRRLFPAESCRLVTRTCDTRHRGGTELSARGGGGRTEVVKGLSGVIDPP